MDENPTAYDLLASLGGDIMPETDTLENNLAGLRAAMQARGYTALVGPDECGECGCWDREKHGYEIGLCDEQERLLGCRLGYYHPPSAEFPDGCACLDPPPGDPGNQLRLRYRPWYRFRPDGQWHLERVIPGGRAWMVKT